MKTQPVQHTVKWGIKSSVEGGRKGGGGGGRNGAGEKGGRRNQNRATRPRAC